LQHAQYLLQNRLRFPQDLVVPKADHAIATIGKPRIALRIRHGLKVLPPIGLDDQLCAEMHEINDVRTQGMLPSELLAAEPVRSEKTPEQALRVRQVLP
jgi:hypothetical protein